MRLVSLIFLFRSCILEEEASNVSLGFNESSPACPPTPLRGKRQDMASWCLELTQVQRLWGVGSQE